MPIIDFILNLVGLLLWVSWRSLSLERFVKTVPASLTGTIKRAGPPRSFPLYVDERRYRVCRVDEEDVGAVGRHQPEHERRSAEEEEAARGEPRRCEPPHHAEDMCLREGCASVRRRPESRRP